MDASIEEAAEHGFSPGSYWPWTTGKSVEDAVVDEAIVCAEGPEVSSSLRIKSAVWVRGHLRYTVSLQHERVDLGKLLVVMPRPWISIGGQMHRSILEPHGQARPTGHTSKAQASLHSIPHTP